MTNQEILQIALQQSAYDCNCNAIRSGFRPAWVELTARDAEFVDKMNE